MILTPNIHDPCPEESQPTDTQYCPHAMLNPLQKQYPKQPEVRRKYMTKINDHIDGVFDRVRLGR
jgi:hypothetical protein